MCWAFYEVLWFGFGNLSQCELFCSKYHADGIGSAEPSLDLNYLFACMFNKCKIF